MNDMLNESAGDADMDMLSGMSLADLADINVADIDEVRFELIPAGVYVFEVVEADMIETENNDKDLRFTASVGLKIVEVKSCLDSRADKEALVNKVITEKKHATPVKSDDTNAASAKERFAKELGRIKAMVVDMGADVGEGGFVAMVQNLKGTIFTAKLIHEPGYPDRSRKRARVELDSKAKK